MDYFKLNEWIGRNINYAWAELDLSLFSGSRSDGTIQRGRKNRPSHIWQRQGRTAKLISRSILFLRCDLLTSDDLHEGQEKTCGRSIKDLFQLSRDRLRLRHEYQV
jgi:hypothetical protein